MTSLQKSVSYQHTNSYETLNQLTKKTENIWIVFHGMGFLSRYFLRFFKDLDPTKNYVIAPQAPSKYYLKEDFKHVGASWLTKENTLSEMDNLNNYLDEVLKAENIPENKKLIVLAFSQGVSVATRWLKQKKLNFDRLILYAGGIPKELTKEDFQFVNFNTSKIKAVYGNKDEYINKQRLVLEKEKMQKLFQGKAEIQVFNGGHILKPELLSQFV